ncbi:MAG: peptidoglycan-binding protein [Parvibaculum sp.]|nr:peptidoglycan-binding protein [Parvibaculum sp.]
MRSGVPWSVKGIEPEAREAAKQAARRAGVTLGAWLNNVIMETGTDEVSAEGGASEPYRNAYAPPQAAPSEPKPASGVDLAPVAEAVREVVQRVENSERRALDMTRRLEATVGQLAARIDQSEHDMDDRYSEARSSEARSLDPLERKLQQLHERMERAERARSGGLRPEDARTIQTLEKAVNAVVDHLDQTERRTDDTLAEIRQSLAALSDRMETAEEESEREEAKKRARALEDALMQLATRMEKMEHGVSGIAPQAVEAALKAIEEKSHAENQRATIERLQTSLEQMAQRLERAELRSDETAKIFETSVTGIARKLEDLDNVQRHEIPQALAQRLEQMAQRLEHNEQLTVQAAQTVEQAIAGISENLSVTDSRDREALTSLQSMIEKMTNRLGHLERETKAVKQAALSPQLNTGGVAAGFAPSGPGFPMPQFDAPPMLNPAMGGNLGPALNPSDWGRPVAPTVSAPPPVDAPYENDAPPYADEDELADTQMRGPADDGIIPPDPAPPPMENAGQRAANDFLAAARRAAQAAAQGGQTPRQEPYYATPPAPGYAESPARFSAEDPGRGRRKLFFGVAASFVFLALMAGTYLMLQEGPAQRIAPLDAPNDQSGTQPSVLDAEGTGAATNKDPEASPEDAGATANDASVPASTTPSTAQPATPDEALVPTPPSTAKPSAPSPATARPAGQATLTPAPSLTPAPAKPVETAPVEPVRLTLMEAAAGGDAAAQYEVGQRYAVGEGVTQDMSQAAEWFERAADQGLAIAQYRLATQYEKGRGVTQDDAKARSLYEKAATSGNVKAMHNLAVIHAEGRGTAQDFVTAAKWFEEAANYGLGDSQYNLAVLNERGLGIEKNATEAYKWLAIAAKGGDKGAAAKRDALAATMDAGELAKAKVATETWRAKTPAPLANGDISSLKSWDVSSLGNLGNKAAVPARDAIARTQALLNRLGYDAGSPDGQMGPRTRDALLDYQMTEGLEATGTVTPETLATLEARFG